MTAWYVPKPVTQRDPSDPQQFSHCWAAVGAWQLAAATDGASKVTAKAFAKAAGGGSGRKTGSGTQEDIVNGLAHYGVKADIIDLPVGDATRILGRERRAVWAVATDYDVWPSGKDCMRGEAGPDVNHEVGVIGGDPPTIMNPLCDDYQNIPLATLIQAAAKYARQNGHSRTLQVVRVMRQQPTSNIGDKATIAEQQDLIDRWQEYGSATRALANRILDLPVPK